MGWCFRRSEYVQEPCNARIRAIPTAMKADSLEGLVRALFAKFSRLIGVLISYSWWLGWNLEVMLQLLLLWKACVS